MNPTSWLIHIVGALLVALGAFFFGCKVTSDHFEAKSAKAIAAADAEARTKVHAAEIKGAENAQANLATSQNIQAAYVSAVRDNGRLRVSCARPVLPSASAAATAIDNSASGAGYGGDRGSEIDLTGVAGRILALGEAKDNAVAELRSCQRDLQIRTSQAN